MSTNISRLVDTVLCAFCRLERRVYVKKHIDWTNVLLSFFAAILMMFVAWQNIDQRALLFFSMNLIVAEIFVHMRWRISLPCTHCGFDPLLYKTDREKAAAKVKQTLEEVKASGRHLLTPNNPFKHLPKLSRKDIEKSGSAKVRLQLEKGLESAKDSNLPSSPKDELLY